MSSIFDTLTFALDTTPHVIRDYIDAYDPEPDTARARFTAPDALTAAAHWYAANGIPVFPCKPGSKTPATSHGFKDATTNTGQITQWWTTNPQYNIAIPTGIFFDVLDIDHPTLAWPQLRQEITTKTLTPFQAVHTPRGLHYYLPPAPEARNTTNIVPGADFRANGGYVLTPPSVINPSPIYPGGRYRWAGAPWPTANSLTAHGVQQEAGA
ncbi:bifunctional DNA primase/polymerase [Trueperella pyogenes]|uniref:bifunctional DNA primase/polymerase n=1 Tax=Trueperella pyogenes TaxID=1661 RepID=UPI0032557E12